MRVAQKPQHCQVQNDEHSASTKKMKKTHPSGLNHITKKSTTKQSDTLQLKKKKQSLDNNEISDSNNSVVATEHHPLEDDNISIISKTTCGLKRKLHVVDANEDALDEGACMEDSETMKKTARTKIDIRHKMNKKDRHKNTNTIASKMKQVVEKLIHGQQYNKVNPLLTIFIYKSQQSEIVSSFLHEIRKENDALFGQRDKLLELITKKYDDFVLTINENNTSCSIIMPFQST